MAGGAGPAEVRHHFSGINVLVQVSENKHKARLCKCMLALSLNPRTLDTPAPARLNFFILSFLSPSLELISLFIPFYPTPLSKIHCHILIAGGQGLTNFPVKSVIV